MTKETLSHMQVMLTADLIKILIHGSEKITDSSISTANHLYFSGYYRSSKLQKHILALHKYALCKMRELNDVMR